MLAERHQLRKSPTLPERAPGHIAGRPAGRSRPLVGASLAERSTNLHGAAVLRRRCRLREECCFIQAQTARCRLAPQRRLALCIGPRPGLGCHWSCPYASILSLFDGPESCAPCPLLQCSDDSVWLGRGAAGLWPRASQHAAGRCSREWVACIHTAGRMTGISSSSGRHQANCLTPLTKACTHIFLWRMYTLTVAVVVMSKAGASSQGMLLHAGGPPLS